MSEEKKEGKLSDLTARTLTGIVYSVVFGAAVIYSPLSTMALILVIAGFCSHELCVMMRRDARLTSEFLSTVVAMLYPVAYYFLKVNGVFYLTLLFLIVELVIFVLYGRMRIADCAVSIFVSLYTGLMPTCLLAIRMGFGAYLPWLWAGLATFGVVLSIWANDVFAYLVGSLIGRHKLAPRISPGKSWEGAVAGLVGGIIVWCLMPLLIPGIGFGYPAAIIAGAVCAPLGIFGDLAESRIKRAAGAKDSGNSLPGHGGFLDRCDTVIVVSVVAFGIFQILGIM